MWPSYDQDEIAAVAEVLASGKVNYWTGTKCREFENEYARHTGRRHAVALHNGTLALELALHAFNIGPGDEVITTSRTFIASASCAVMRGATPIFADVDSESQNITASSIEQKISKRTKAIIPVHLAGWPCEMDKIMDLAGRHDIKVIEDCAQAHGATYRNRPVGSFGHAAAFSFCQDKIISTCGEGGMLVLDDEDAWLRAWSFKDHGKSYDAVYNQAHPPGFRWLHDNFGTNWRMLEIQAAVGSIQLAKLPRWVLLRQRNAAIFNAAFSNIETLRVTVPPAHIGHAYYKYYAFVRPELLHDGWTRDRIMHEINEQGVPCYAGSCSEIYLEKAFDKAGLRPAQRLPIAQELGETSLMFLVHPTLTEEEVARTAEAAVSVLNRAKR